VPARAGRRGSRRAARAHPIHPLLAPFQNLLNNLGLAPPVTLTLDLKPPPGGGPRATALARPRGGGDPEPVPLFCDGDTVAGEVGEGGREGGKEGGAAAAASRASPTGPPPPPSAPQVRVTPAPGRRLDHAGVKIRLLGRVELAGEGRGGRHDFVTLVRDLAPPGVLAATATLPFEFARVELPYESYGGRAARVRYALKASAGGWGRSPRARARARARPV
jgi:vacuolar protein sorting-associated protein 26